MTSFSINSILDLQETKCGSSQTNSARKNAFAFEELEEHVMSKEYRVHRRSPNSALDSEDASYEGKVGGRYNFLLHKSIFVA